MLFQLHNVPIIYLIKIRNIRRCATELLHKREFDSIDLDLFRFLCKAVMATKCESSLRVKGISVVLLYLKQNYCAISYSYDELFLVDQSIVEWSIWPDQLNLRYTWFDLEQFFGQVDILVYAGRNSTFIRLSDLGYFWSSSSSQI